MRPPFFSLKKIWITVVLLCCFALLTLYLLPTVFEKSVIPRLFSRIGISKYECNIYRLHPFGCDFRIQVGSEQHPAVSTGVVHVSWTPVGLLQRKVQEVVIYGLQLQIPPTPLKNEPVTSLQRGNKGSTNGAKERAFTRPFILEKLLIKESSFHFSIGKQEHVVPFVADFQRKSDDSQSPETSLIYNFRIRQPVSKQNLQGIGRIHSDPPGVSIQSIGILNPPVLLSSLSDHPKMAGLHFGDTGEMLTVNLKLELSAGDGPLQWNVEARLPPQINTKLSHPKISIPTGKGLFSGTLESFVFFAHGDTSEAEAKITGNLIDGMYRDGKTSFELQSCGIDSQVKIFRNHKESQNQFTINSMLTGKLGQITRKSLKVTIPKLVLNSKLTVDLSIPESSRVVNMLNVYDAHLLDLKNKLSIGGLQLRLPFQFPLHNGDHNIRSGHLSINDISFRKQHLGSLDLELHQQDRGVAYTGRYHGVQPPGFELDIDGHSMMNTNGDQVTDITYTNPEYSFSIADLSPLIPTLEGINGQGLFTLHGHLQAESSVISHNADVTLHDMELNLPGHNIVFKNIRTSLHLPTLPELNSSPRQTISIDSIKVGGLFFSDAKFDYRIESPESIFIEKGILQWAGGRLHTGSLRINPRRPEINTAFYCDRIVLAELFQQFGLADVSGEGRISGRLPVSFQPGKLVIDNGFLFSTPGETQVLEINDSPFLTTIIPGKDERISPLQFAGAALKNFEYDWAKLLMNTEDENLRIELRVFGKPVEPLPFQFDADKSSFVRLPKNHRATIRQPLNLDVNFNVPINELLKQRDVLMPILKAVQKKG